jgi:nitrogen regulatory protein PII-like uncharacterized protein
MTDNEIIKALECCTSEEIGNRCPVIVRGVMKDAFDLINRQKAEIERLTKIVEEQHESCLIAMDVFKAEAVKEFAERANEKLSYYLEKCGDFAPYGMANFIDNLVKEMTEEEEK